MLDLVRSAVRRVLEKSGRGTNISPELTTVNLVTIMSGRLLELIRGLARFQRIVFLGSGVKIRGKRNVTMAKYSAIGDRSKVDGISRHGVNLGHGAKLGRYVTVTGTSSMSTVGAGLQIGRNSAIGDFGHVGCAGGVFIGDDVIIGPLSSFHSQEHVAESSTVPIRLQGTREEAINIEEDVWVGARVTFLAGSYVGAHSVVAAGAVVRGRFPPYSVIGGVPARLLRSREAANVDSL
ncbi:hypothetical protein [Microbacterium sp. NPDC077184]|uniref:acyltransferase n=1 Tax=Microbacterium sp. NPDC077184 TaxID=3154764 RepID=UPI00343B53D1